MLKKLDLVYWCVVKERQLFLPEGQLPLMSADELGMDTASARKIGEFESTPVYWLEAAPDMSEEDFASQRDLLNCAPELFDLAGRATQMSHMVATQQFCSSCGGRCTLAEHEFAMHCQGCGAVHYPRVSPCVIMAVRKDDSILLAQHPRHKNGMYTVLAGFVEAGETLEQCVAREVFEETGIKVKNIRYFGSQPWAFPSNLMMAFTAEHEAGELTPDYEELTDAFWATADTMPEVAPKGTIARALIEQTLAEIKEK